MDTTEIRLARLERECRQWRRRGVIAVLIGALVAVIGGARKADEPKTVEAERFVVRDKAGKVRAEMGLDSEGLPQIRLSDKDGVNRWVGLVKGDTPSLSLHGKDGQ